MEANLMACISNGGAVFWEGIERVAGLKLLAKQVG